MRKIIALLLLLVSFPAIAADNTVILTPGSGVTMRTQDVGSGVQSPYNILGNISGTSIYGTAGTSNAAVLSVQGIASGTALPVSSTTLATAANQATEIAGIGAIGDAAWTSGNGSIIAIAKTIAGNTGAAIPAGTAVIGKVGVDQTTPGTTNGAAIVGINAATALAGNGATGTGSIRVTIANDNTFPTGWGATTIASGAVASGAYASGSIASGAVASGAMVDLGAQADSACSTDNGTCSLIALQKRGNQRLTTINSSIGAANAYETVAVNATAQSLGATGATGDYLSHCVATPGTTSPGVVTILDNATAIVSFAGGASSVSNLVPFAIPIGAISVSGAWKITTGANITVVCVGRFT